MLTHEFCPVAVSPAAGIAVDANFHLATFRFLLGWLIFLPEDLKVLRSRSLVHMSY